jgi:hypothetical protein
MPLAVAPTMPNFNPGEKKISDLSPSSSTGVGISSDEMTRGVDLPLPNPFDSRGRWHARRRLLWRQTHQSSMHWQVLRPVGCHISMAYGGTLIPSNTDDVVGV